MSKINRLLRGAVVGGLVGSILPALTDPLIANLFLDAAEEGAFDDGNTMVRSVGLMIKELIPRQGLSDAIAGIPLNWIISSAYYSVFLFLIGGALIYLNNKSKNEQLSFKIQVIIFIFVSTVFSKAALALLVFPPIILWVFFLTSWISDYIGYYFFWKIAGNNDETSKKKWSPTGNSLR